MLTFGTMAVSAFVYSFLAGPWFAIGFVLLLFVHEMGHVIAMRIKGLPTKAPVFIPMLGAVIFAPPFNGRETEAFVGFGGPLAGTLGSVAVFALWLILPEHPQVLLAISFVSLYLNIFNLIPIRPLDGGRVTQAVGVWLKYLGAGILIIIPIVSKDAGMLLLWILILGEIRMTCKSRVRLGITCELIMITLIVLGCGEPHKLSNIIDITVASMINFNYVVAEDGDEPKNNLPQLSKLARLKWLSLYLGLGIFILCMMAIESPFMITK